MNGFIKRFSDFSTAKTFRAVEWDIALRSVQDEVSTVVVVAGDVDAGDVGDWIIMGGALLRIESVQAGSSTTTVKCRDIASAFARTFLLQDLMEDETISYFIMDTLGQQFEVADDAAYALPYLTASATTEGDIAYHAPETDDYGRFEFDEYLRMVARVYNIHLSWSITGADELSITVGRGTMRGGQIVLGAGADQLAETPIFASAEVAKITVLQKTTAEDGTETVSKLDRYLYTDGTFGTSATGGTRAEGGWEYLTVSPNATADEIEDKVAQRFERGMSDSKISFFSARDLDVGAPVVLRVSGRKYSGYITYKGIKSSDKRYFYRCGNRPVTLTEKLRAVEKTAQTAEPTAGGSGGGGGGTGGAVTSVNGKTGAVTIGAEIVSGEDITPSQVDIPNGPTSIARLGATTDGRGVMELRRADGTLGVKAYANTASGGEIDIHNGDGNRRAALYTTTDGDGRLRLWDGAGSAHTLTAERLGQTPLKNYLDNSDFRNPVNQRGYQSGQSVEAYKIFIDRWWNNTNSSQTYHLSEDGLTIPGDANITQYLETVRSGDTYTFAIGLSTGDVHTVTGVFAFSEDGSWLRCAEAAVTDGFIALETYVGRAAVVVFADSDMTIMWAALYAGAYGPAELPEYQPKGYGAELAECQRYFCRINYSWQTLATASPRTSTSTRSGLILAQKMRIMGPTCTYGGTNSVLISTEGNKTITGMSVSVRWNVLTISCTAASVTVGTPYAIYGNSSNEFIDISADI